MHVLFLNRAYLPGVEATGQYLGELTTDLSVRHRVSVICGRPNFADLQGRVIPYRWEQWDAVNVLRAWGTRWPKRMPLARMANQASFFAMAVLAAGSVPRPDVVVALTDPPFLGLLGLRLKRLYGIPFIYYCHDLYPDVAEAVGMAPRALADAFEIVHRRIVDGADRVVALGDDMAERLTAKGTPAERLAVVRNWVDTAAIRPVKACNGFRRDHGLDGRFVVMYSGNFGHVWDLDTLLDAAGRLQSETDVVFVLVGDGSRRPAVERRVRDERLTNVRLLPYQPKERLAESLSAADLHVVPMRRGVYGTVVPSKIYGILASGTPMAVLAERESEACRVIRDHDCGWVGPPETVESLLEAIRAARTDGGLVGKARRARAAAVEHYDRPIQTGKFEAVLESAVRSRDRLVA